MRSALAGAASNVVAVKTAAAVPMSVIERMFHLLWCSATDTQSCSLQKIFDLVAEHSVTNRRWRPAVFIEGQGHDSVALSGRLLRNFRLAQRHVPVLRVLRRSVLSSI